MSDKKPADTTRLSDLQSEIQDVLQGSFRKARWVVAEISEVNINFSGHCYLDLVEKDEKSDKLMARARATIWSSTYRMLKPYFETATGYELTAGIKVLVSAKVEYHPVYGLSLNIQDIDPGYTLGDVERKRQEIINRLIAEGVFDMNRDTYLPPVPQKIAVISSATAAGYEDFMEQLHQNPHGYVFYTRLYPAVMQGEKTESSIIAALEKIFEKEDFFDAVVIIRGGGSRSDLASFDSYEIAFHVSQFPLPVLTGIGHEQDETICDMVAHTRLKTPTAVAEFLVDRLAAFDGMLDEYSETLVEYSRAIIRENDLRLQLSTQKAMAATEFYLRKHGEHLLRLSSRSRHEIQRSIARHKLMVMNLAVQLSNRAKNLPQRKAVELEYLSGRLQKVSLNRTELEKGRLETYWKLNNYADPATILKLGFSVTRRKGKALKTSRTIRPGDTLDTELSEGKIKSKVTDI